MDPDLLAVLERFKGKNILVIGDIMLDKYIFGDVERISPEAPVQVVNVKEEKYIPGGAANVSNNIASLGANVFMVGVIGNDRQGEILLEELKKRNIQTKGIFEVYKKPTTHKIRILGQKQQLLRLDYENKDYLDRETEIRMIRLIKEKISCTDAVIISDYAKGVITETLVKEIKKLAKEKVVIADPKPKHKRFYKDVTLITPNLKEAGAMSDKEEGLLIELNAPILVTKGEKGMSLYEKGGKVTDIPAKAKEVYDVSGAGDTVVAVLSLALSSGSSLRQAAMIANHAAGITVGKVGTSTVSLEEIRQSLEDE
ncbi:D-glycero-beta-D-manno-heptose-7-phosphate kinase [Candidatus Woesearchaeota archaeon]|nr:D-glycero-beta-D-manno-heptose-7-phosphate kinase [Candidatus Woesearchaeota archaeon]